MNYKTATDEIASPAFVAANCEALASAMQSQSPTNRRPRVGTTMVGQDRRYCLLTAAGEVARTWGGRALSFGVVIAA